MMRADPAPAGARNPVSNPSDGTCIPRPSLPLGRYRVRFRECLPEGAPSLASPRADYLGSAWRGVFGRALRKTVCVTRLPACDPCALLRSCPYPFLFESRTPPSAEKLTRYPHTPGPYVLEPADPRFDTGEEGMVNLGVTLFGPANDHLPYVVHALDRAGRGGLTARRIRLEMVDVQAESPGGAAPRHGAAEGGAADGDASRTRNGGWSTVFEPGGRLSSVRAGLSALPPSPPPAAVRVRLLTPLRMRRQGRFAGAADFDFRAFASHLLRRISLLTYFFGDTPLETDFAGLLRRAESVPTAERTLHWQDWTRHSSRQQADVPMGGVVGCFRLDRPGLDPFWPMLWIGQWTHVGRGCSMGLGRYALEPAGTVGTGAAPDPGSDGERWPAPLRL